MKILICHNAGMQRHVEPLNAFGDGARAQGHKVYRLQAVDFFDVIRQTAPDVTVIFGTGHPGRGKNARTKWQIVEYCKKQGVPVVHLEEGYIHRGAYWSVSVNGLPAVGEYTHNNIDLRRADCIVGGIKPLQWRDGPVLLCKQVPWDANVNMDKGDYEKWAELAAAQVERLGLRCKIREHPRLAKVEQGDLLYELQENCKMVYTFSSNTAIDALRYGVPVCVASKNHIAGAVSTPLGFVDRDEKLPSWKLQHRVLNEVANAQWTVDEMESGRCWEHVRQLRAIKKAAEGVSE